MTKFLLAFLLISIQLLFLFAKTPQVLADDPCDISNCPTDANQRLVCLDTAKNNCQKLLNNAQGQEKTLKSQLDYISAQTKLTELKMDEANTQIAKLDLEINDLSTRITRLSSTIDSMTQILLNRIIETYKYSDVTPVDLLFSSHGFSDMLTRLKYIQVAQENDKQVLYRLQATKATYHDQKSDKETRQTQQEKLKKDLEVYQIQLDSQEQQKAKLLAETKNSEAIYQAKITAAQQEAQAILAILNGQGNEVADGPVHTNDVIGHMIYGPSPCSGGTHVHFEVHQNNSIQDPNNYLASVSFQYLDNDGGKDEGAISPHGSWGDWPVFAPIAISQGFGMTPYATGALDGIRHYNGGPHTGIDMITSTGSLAVKSVHDGTKYTGQLIGVCTGGPLHYMKVDHGDGISSYYLHVT